MRSTAVASTTTMPARAMANCIKCWRCQSVALPSSAEYWHIGETAMRLGKVSGPTLSGSKRLGTGAGSCFWRQHVGRGCAGSFSVAPAFGKAKICGTGRRRSKPAEPVVALILPVAAGVVVEHRQCDHVLGVLEAELGRDANAQRKSELGGQGLAVEFQGHLRLRMQGRRHVDGAGIALGAHEMHVLAGEVGTDAFQEGTQRHPGPLAD